MTNLYPKDPKVRANEWIFSARVRFHSILPGSQHCLVHDDGQAAGVQPAGVHIIVIAISYFKDSLTYIQRVNTARDCAVFNVFKV